MTAGTYYVRVTGYEDNTGSYTLEVDGSATVSSVPAIGSTGTGTTTGTGNTGTTNANGTRQTSTNIALGSAANDVLTSNGQEDFFALRLLATSTARTPVRLTAYTEGSTRVSMFIYDDLNQLLGGNNPAAGAPANVQLVLPEVDTGEWYYIKVQGRTSGTRGSYRLKVDDHGDTRASATPVTTQINGNLVSVGNTDYFRVQIATGNTMLTVYTDGDIDTYGELLSSGGSRLVQDDNGGTDDNFRIEEATVTAGSTYYIKVTGNAGATGDYTLHVAQA